MKKLLDVLMWPAYVLDKRGHHNAAEAYALVAFSLPLVLLASILLVILLLTD